MPRYASFEERIIANTVLLREHFWNGSYCWVWIGKYRTSNRGLRYACMSVRWKSGPRKGKVRTVAVHREVLRIMKGYRMTPRTVGGHLCNYSLCVNPEHLSSMSQKANVRQTVRDGRHRNGYSEPLREAA